MLVDSVTVVELGQDSMIVAQQNYSEPYYDGDSFDYVSVVSDDNSVFPKGIQLNVYGQNANGDDIANIILVTFTNNCSVYPVFDGFSEGWAMFVSMAGHPYFCEGTFEYMAHLTVSIFRKSLLPLRKEFVLRLMIS